VGVGWLWNAVVGLLLLEGAAGWVVVWAWGDGNMARKCSYHSDISKDWSDSFKSSKYLEKRRTKNRKTLREAQAEADSRLSKQRTTFN
jgi:hypothetical protein